MTVDKRVETAQLQASAHVYVLIHLSAMLL